MGRPMLELKEKVVDSMARTKFSSSVYSPVVSLFVCEACAPKYQFRWPVTLFLSVN
jgi:hypothetical protein